jgi:hypothetical protein
VSGLRWCRPGQQSSTAPANTWRRCERHVDKHLWKLPISLYDASNNDHQRLAELGRREAEHVADLDLDERANFVQLRRQVRAALAGTPTALEIAELVEELLGI